MSAGGGGGGGGGGHGHGHAHGGACAHEHGAEDLESERGRAWSLYKYVDTPKVRVLNATDTAAAARCFRPFDERATVPADGALESDADEELIVHVPFTASVKVKALMFVGVDSGSAPRTVRCFINRDDVDFTNVADLEPLAEFDTNADLVGELEYATKYAKWQNVQSLTLHISANCADEDVTKVSFIGIKGEHGQKITREAVIAVYEARAMPEDHKTKAEQGATSKPGGAS
eukprot:CAMPEP_0198344216 /NCGR_PEP_ID=MMETSP1450-20131203/66153_1 /TAXON_ID=753684 ORGANISM="Madagascaria erythrocladiodes, Strain CCMP3234" /NCGR_SAMPLE_ID=MMETSP1450 /ASSEMBLY_ACC=CAM_ASM_001115 /LENGTH=230 /DNA_ID=CAMNT_0044049459 /DNA_START=59 /DNA_END=751 /DNA_ORIENTATION=-